MKKIFSLLVIVAFLGIIAACTNIENEVEENPNTDILDKTKKYKIAIAKEDRTYEIISSQDKFTDAKKEVLEDNRDDLIILLDEEIIYVKYGVAYLKTKTISENTTFSINGVKNYTNGHYGIDALFIDSERLSYKIMINGGIGWVNYSDVVLYPDVYIKEMSHYIVNSESELVHVHAKNLDIENAKFNSAPIDFAPSYLEQGVKYYSYDGHYFYLDYKDLIKDEREGNHIRAVNPDTPYYSYYQYLPMRSLSSYTKDDYNEFLNYYLDLYGYSSRSILVNSGEEFENIQNLFKINGAIELVWALHESGYGTSRIARDKFNVFGMNATDNNPYGNATEFNSLQDGISYHAHYYVSNKYMNSMTDVYFGAALGNKRIGFNVSYASDPYWGEKIAAMYFKLDKFLGLKDYNKYRVGVTIKSTNIYQDTLITRDVLYIETARKDMDRSGLPVIIIEETDKYYKIMLNAPLVDGEIDPYMVFDYNQQSVGYVNKEDIYIIN